MVAPRHPRYTEALEALRAGEDPASIAAHIGVSASTVRRWRQTMRAEASSNGAPAGVPPESVAPEPAHPVACVPLDRVEAAPAPDALALEPAPVASLAPDPTPEEAEALYRLVREGVTWILAESLGIPPERIRPASPAVLAVIRQYPRETREILVAGIPSRQLVVGVLALDACLILIDFVKAWKSRGATE